MQNTAGCSVGIFIGISAFEGGTVGTFTICCCPSLSISHRVAGSPRERHHRRRVLTRSSSHTRIEKMVRELLTLIHLLHCVPRMNPSLSISLSLWITRQIEDNSPEAYERRASEYKNKWIISLIEDEEGNKAGFIGPKLFHRSARRTTKNRVVDHTCQHPLI